VLRRSLVGIGAACVIVAGVLMVARTPAPSHAPRRCDLATCAAPYAVGYREGFSSPTTRPKGVTGTWTRSSVCVLAYEVVEDPSSDRAAFLAGCARGWDAALAAAAARHHRALAPR